MLEPKKPTDDGQGGGTEPNKEGTKAVSQKDMTPDGGETDGGETGEK